MFSKFFKSTHHLNVNLLPKDPFAESPVGKFLNWALSIGRYIVVFTELIVIVTFLTRFSLDRQLTDLNESIYEKQQFLQAYSALETSVRSIQRKAEFIEEVSSQTRPSSVFSYVSSLLPVDIEFDTIDISHDRFSIVGRSFSQKSLETFVETLKNNPNFSQVSLEQLKTSNQDTTIEFVIQTTYSADISNSISPQPL